MINKVMQLFQAKARRGDRWRSRRRWRPQLEQLEDRVTPASIPLPFTDLVIDNDNPINPHSKTVGDINNDGQLDVIVASSAGGGMYWYQAPTWTKIAIRTSGSWTTDVQAADIDNDGWRDVVIPNSSGILWYKNPGASGGEWAEVNIGSAGANNHDVEIGDLNHDGRLDVVTRSKSGGVTNVWLQNTPTSWTHVAASARDGEGTALGDLDRDGDLDIAHNGFWLENLDSGTGWPAHTFDSNWPNDVGVHVADINKDGRSDIVIGPSESASGRLSWYDSSSPRSGPWTEHVIDSNVSYLHTFEVADVNEDGHPDIVTAEMHQSSDPDEVSVYYNLSGNGLAWEQQVVSTVGSHNLRVGDIGEDGDIDIIGANWNDGAPDSAVVRIFRNDLNSALSLDDWQRYQIDPSIESGSVFVHWGDIDRDGKPDMIAGPNWYKNPGSVSGAWAANPIGPGFNNLSVVEDFDHDGDLDLLGTSFGANFVWARNNGSGQFTILSNIENGQGDFLGGAAAARFRPGGPLEVVLAWHNSGGGVQVLNVPNDPSSGVWAWRNLTTVTQREQISIGDIDRDGDLDLLLGTIWLRNPGAANGAWTSHTIGSLTAGDPDRNRLVDINNDGRLDAVVALKNATDILYFEAPADPTQPWTRHVIGNAAGQGFSMDADDIDGDGDIDVVLGEHRGSPNRVLIFENLGDGSSWSSHVVDAGASDIDHHDGTQLVDLDRDGDLDIISIGWTNPKVWVYENLANHVVSNNEAPTVATPAGASPNPVTGATTNLSVLGADDDDESNLTYNWIVTAKPSAAADPTFSANGANAAKNTTANFSHAGSYTFQVTIRDAGGLTVTTSVNVTVNQTLTSITLSPASLIVLSGQTQQFSATARDQFGVALSTQPSFSWSIDAGGVGAVSSTGLYTAPASETGSATVRAVGDSLSGTATVTVAETRPDLVAHWQFDEGGGPTSADVSGNGHHGALVNGAAWTAGQTGGAIGFDGVNDRVEAGAFDVTGSALTLAAWIKADSFDTNDGRIISKAIGVQEQDHYWMLSTIGVGGEIRLRFRLKTGSNTTTLIASSGALNPGIWYHAAATYDGSTMRLYLNDVLVGSTSKTGSLAGNPSVGVWIGDTPPPKSNSGGSKPFHGAIDDVRVYNWALSFPQFMALG